MFQLMLNLVITAFLLSGIAAILAAVQLRRAPGLPSGLSPGDVSDAHRLLHVIGEHGRRLPGPAGSALVSALLVADAAVSLWFSAPVLLPELTPTQSALLVAVTALIVAKVLRVGVTGLAGAIRRAQVRLRHGRLAASLRESDRDDARTLRAVYRSAIHEWPLPPRFTWRALCWAGTIQWLVYLGALIAMLLSLRVFAASTLEDLAGMAVLTVLVVCTLVFAVREAVALESLTTPVAGMRRICARFESARALREYMASEHRAVELQLQAASKTLANASAREFEGDARPSMNLVTAWHRRMNEPAVVASDPRDRRPGTLSWEDA